MLVNSGVALDDLILYLDDVCDSMYFCNHHFVIKFTRQEELPEIFMKDSS